MAISTIRFTFWKKKKQQHSNSNTNNKNGSKTSICEFHLSVSNQLDESAVLFFRNSIGLLVYFNQFMTCICIIYWMAAQYQWLFKDSFNCRSLELSFISFHSSSVQFSLILFYFESVNSKEYWEMKEACCAIVIDS